MIQHSAVASMQLTGLRRRRRRAVPFPAKLSCARRILLMIGALCVMVLSCSSREPLSLCEVVKALGVSPLKRITGIESILSGVRKDADGTSVVTLSGHPPWRSLLVLVDVDAENPAGVKRRHFGPLEWLEPSDTAELQLLLEQEAGRRVDATVVRGAVWLLAQRRSFRNRQSLARARLRRVRE